MIYNNNNTLTQNATQPTHQKLNEEHQLNQRWERVKMRLRAAYGEAIFKNWLKGMALDGIHGSQVIITVPTRFMREWILSHYSADILKFWRMEDTNILAVDILVRSNSMMSASTTGAVKPIPVASPVSSDIEPVRSNSFQTGGSAIIEANDPHFSSPLDPRYTFENFVVGKPNELAFAAARRVAETPTVAPGCNPLFLYGGVGLGKTHLMHAIAWHIRRNNPARRVMYLSAEKFMYQFIRALRQKEAIEFKEVFRSVDVLMIDDVQFISGKDSTQEEFFHTFNALVDQNKQLVISGDRSPSDLEGIEERVRSRLGWGLVADIHTTSFELRMGILESKIEKMPGMEIPQKVLEFLAHKITSNVRELEGALNRVVAHATLVGRPISLETTQEVLHDLLRANDRRITIEDIQKQVAAHFNIKVADMHSARRSRSVARPRQVAMYLSKKLTTKSLPEIGRKFGGKDHTTVMHAVKKVDELSAIDNEFAQDVELLTKMLQS
jgi:chromosomal replication initiator protein